MRKNINMPITHMFDRHSVLKWVSENKEKRPLIFDQDHNAKACEDRAYKRLAENDWDTFRDLRRVFESPFAHHDESNKQKYYYQNTLMIDSDSRKVQFEKDNSIINRPYTWEDVQHVESKTEGLVRTAFI